MYVASVGGQTFEFTRGDGVTRIPPQDALSITDFGSSPKITVPGVILQRIR